MRRTILLAVAMFGLSTPVMAQVGGAGGAQPPGKTKIKVQKPAQPKEGSTKKSPSGSPAAR